MRTLADPEINNGEGNFYKIIWFSVKIIFVNNRIIIISIFNLFNLEGKI